MKISVYITSFNQKEYLVEAIESVLAQTTIPHQIIIVDDASEDGSQQVIAGYKIRYPNLIHAIYHPENQGVVRTRNDALRVVTGDYVSYLDGDDRFLPRKIEIEANTLRANPGAAIAYSNVYIINPAGKRIALWANQDPPQGDVFMQTFARDFPRRRLFRNELVHYPSWKRVGYFDPNLQMYEDYEMRIRLTKHLKVVYTGVPLVEYRRHASGLSRLRARIYLDSYYYLSKKNLHLLDDLDEAERRYVVRSINRWKAVLLRRQGREIIRNEPNLLNSRKLALGYYQQALKLHRHLDIIFWLEFCLPRTGFQLLRSVIGKMSESAIK